jgi:NAD-dependent DNA ligase
MIFIYKDAKGRITKRTVNDFKEDETHFTGICQTARDLRTFRKDRVLEWLDSQDSADQRLKFHIENNPPPTPRESKRNTEGQTEVCFTGFKKADKNRLIQFAIDNEFHVASGITKNLYILCCGYNRGPSKVEKAISQGANILSEKQFVNFVNTGELPDE